MPSRMSTHARVIALVFSSSRAMISDFQKAAVSVSKFSATTRYFSFFRALITLRECGPLLTGFMPKLKKPSILPLLYQFLPISWPPRTWASAYTTPRSSR
mgnify:CR=1 FL=1